MMMEYHETYSLWLCVAVCELEHHHADKLGKSSNYCIDEIIFAPHALSELRFFAKREQRMRPSKQGKPPVRIWSRFQHDQNDMAKRSCKNGSPSTMKIT